MWRKLRIIQEIFKGSGLEKYQGFMIQDSRLDALEGCKIRRLIRFYGIWGRYPITDFLIYILTMLCNVFFLFLLFFYGYHS